MGSAMYPVNHLIQGMILCSDFYPLCLPLVVCPLIGFLLRWLTSLSSIRFSLPMMASCTGQLGFCSCTSLWCSIRA
uniref:Uncharacterized protein n=1 Tax=Proteus vulgaris TaxID=585 RepID=Q8KK04_PROVU|nr:hypothetical protein [Proteus vulgaris]